TISGVEPAPGLAAAASTGVATVDALARSFQDAAQDGYAAALADEAGDGVADRMFAAVQGRIGGRPSVETEGDDVGAVLSRIEARLRDGDVEAARTEAGGLSDAAIGAMSGWLATLETTADARAGFDAFRAALATN
ncbi:MAG: mitofilin family membrane protein, partial [Pseudomonadota bacterium]